MNGHVYGLCYKDNQLSSLTTEYEDCCDTTNSQGFGRQRTDMGKKEKQRKVSSATITYQNTSGDEIVPQFEMVEVFWNFPASSLSFFSRIGQYQREEITTIKMSLNNWDLAPFVQLGKKTGQDSQQQQRWRCSCGKVYRKEGNSYYDEKQHNCYQTNCPCGAFFFGTTELVCELE